jgi:putative phage-type endonuclease
MDRKAWLEWRRGGIGSSDAAVIMGIDPWKTKYELYCEKVFGYADDNDNAAMARGRALEPIVRSRLEREYEMLLEPRNVERPPIHRASLDAISFDGRFLFEIKCPGEKAHAVARGGKVPDYYMPQLQHQLLVTGLSHLTYVSFRDEELIEIAVMRQPEYIETLEKEELAFWARVVNRDPPQKESKDHDDKTNDVAWSEAAEAWLESKKNLDLYEETEKQARAALISLSNGGSSLGAGVKVTKVTEEGRIDYKSAYEELLLIAKEAGLEDLGFSLEPYRKSPIIKYRLGIC